tara:strand:+ start:3971 stop:5077 length:1107 start_codon:yes stop_codon:yes gene_type:complete
MTSFIPQIEPFINELELKYLKQVVESTYVTENKLTKEFEDRIKKLTGAKHAIAVCNGTAALFCCLKALDIGAGDEVIVPNLTFIATANAVIMAGAVPVLCDIRREDLSFDLEKLESCITAKTKAIMPVHLYGFSADMDSITEVADKYGLKVIEDAAQGVGVRYKGTHTGTMGDMGVLSFYGNKTITCGEGGIVLTDDDKLSRRCYQLKNHGRSSKGVFVHESIGYNFCFTEMQAAVGLAQLDKLQSIIDTKQGIRDKYVLALDHLKEDLEPLTPDAHTSPVYWFTSFLTPYKKELQSYLKERGVQTREFFYPLDMQPCYDTNVIRGSTFKNSHELYSLGISLPSSYSLNWGEQQRVITAIEEFFQKDS